jgi:hypothetical protein
MKTSFDWSPLQLPLLVVLVSRSSSSCLSVATATAVAHEMDKTEKYAFFRRIFSYRNKDRVDAGLEPLDWCDTAHEFDADWAKTLPECRHMLLYWEENPDE